MAGQIFMRVNEVAEELGVSVPYAYKLIKKMNEELKQTAASQSPAELTVNFFTRNSTVREARQKGKVIDYGSVQKQG